MFRSFNTKCKAFRELRKSSLIRSQICAENSWEPTQIDCLRAAKRSSVLFILGSGESVCALSGDQWAEISRCDSFGINFWILHPHVPNYYCFEIPRAAYFRECLFRNFLNRAYAYSGTQCIFKVGRGLDLETDDYFYKAQVARHFCASVPSYFTVSGSDQFQTMMRNYKAISSAVRRREPNALFRKRASIVFATMLGFDLGFENIVFCGVDGKGGSGYFYRDGSERDLIDGAVIPESTGQKIGAVHSTMDTNHNEMSLELCLRLMQEELFQRSGVQMFVGTENSMLAEWMPKWRWFG